MLDDDDDDRDSAASSDQDADNDEVMEDISLLDPDADADADNDNDGDADGDGNGDNDNDNDDAPDDNDDNDADGNDDDGDDEEADGDIEENEDGTGDDAAAREPGAASTDAKSAGGAATTVDKPGTGLVKLRPSLRPETITAKVYDIVPTMAAPMSTSINALAVTPDMRYIMTGGADGYIRKYDGVSSWNGKLPLTVAQRHPFVDSVFKAGVLMGYWENEEPPGVAGQEQHVLSPVYSLAVHSQALWLLAGTDSGCINLQTVRHDEGKRIAMLQGHTNAVSVLNLAPDETTVLSGSWDKKIHEWDLNAGKIARSFEGSGGQISAVERRPSGGIAIPSNAMEEVPASDTLSANDGSRNNPFFAPKKTNPFAPAPSTAAAETVGSPGHESLFGGSDAGSLFGDGVSGAGFGAGDAFGDFDHSGGDDGLFGQSLESLSAVEVDAEADTQATKDVNMTDADNVAPVSTQEKAASESVQMEAEKPKKEEEYAMAMGLKMETEILSANDTAAMTLALGLDAPQPEKPPSISAGSPPPESRPPGHVSDTTFMSAAIDGTIHIWDRRAPNPVAKLSSPRGTPPWAMAATWSPDGNWIYVGRRNATVEEYSIAKARGGWVPERSLKFPNGSGAISAVRAMPNGRHLICASHDILRLYDLKDTNTARHSVPFLIVPGPPRAGVISHLLIDITGRFMISTAGTRGWEGTSTEVLVGYEINSVQ